MGSNFLYIFGIVFSCLVSTIVIFQFIESRHKRRIVNTYFYLGIKIGLSIILMLINLMNQPIINMLSWIIIFGLVSYLFYYDEINKPLQRILEAEVMILVFTVCEAIGVVLLDYIRWKMQITVTEPNIKAFLDMTFSELVVLFFYYVVISRIWNKNQKVQFTKNQYILHFIIATYSLVNMIIIVEAVSRIEGEAANFLLLLNVGFIVFADMYFLYFVQFIDKSNQTKEKLGLLEQQASMQYKYYLLQEKKYNESMKIMHDVNKHITIIEGLYKDKNTTDAICYTKEINEILKPLIPQRITDHPILNILLNDKMEYADKHNIEIQYEIGNVNLDFMDPIDITTIFGNLLDNAIEACEGIEDEAKWIKIKISPYYKMIAIRIENPSKGHLKWKDKRPVSIKGTGHGIGLCNVEGVVKKYDGTMHLNDENGTFQCNIVINK